MQTEKLYYNDAYIKEFDARVLNCVSAGRCFHIELDRTAFYPEGGGQPADQGIFITGGAEERVFDVHEKDGSILHYCDTYIEPGTAVHGVIDWERRLDHMQQHSGEHIVSGFICRSFSCSNVGFHMGDETVTIDFDADFSWEEAERIEETANRYIREDHPVGIYTLRDGRLLEAEADADQELRQELLNYRSKKEIPGDIRLTAFRGADVCACCGTHVQRSGEIGLVKLISMQKFHNGVRLELVCGKRAFDYLKKNAEQNQAVGKMLSAKYDCTADVVSKLKNDIAELKLGMAKLESRYFELLADKYRGAKDVLVICEAMSPDSTRRLCVTLSEVSDGLTAVFAGEDGKYNYAISESSGCDAGAFSAFIRSMNSGLNGRGGGRGSFAQGSVMSSEKEINSFFAAVQFA